MFQIDSSPSAPTVRRGTPAGVGEDRVGVEVPWTGQEGRDDGALRQLGIAVEVEVGDVRKLGIDHHAVLVELPGEGARLYAG